MSRHSNLCRDIKQSCRLQNFLTAQIFCRDTIKCSKKETVSQQSFYCCDISFEYSSCKALKKCRDTRYSCRDNYRTNSTELCRDIFKLCRDIIKKEKGAKDCRDRTLQATIKLEDKDDNYVAT